MQERQVTIGDTTYPLSDPFLVLATQNPLEQEGTYQLPEAQLDRFMLKLRVGYPSKAEEREILDLMGTSAPKLEVLTVTEPADIIRSRQIVNEIYVDNRVKDYIVDVVFATRQPSTYKLKLDGLIRYGASPRATIALTLAARARAFMARSRLCHPAGCQIGWPRCPAPPHYRELRSGGRGEDERANHRNNFCRAARAVIAEDGIR